MHRATLATFGIFLFSLPGWFGCVSPLQPSYEMVTISDKSQNVSTTRMVELFEPARLHHEDEKSNVLGEVRLRPYKGSKQNAVTYVLEVVWRDEVLGHHRSPMYFGIEELMLTVDNDRHVLPVLSTTRHSGISQSLNGGFWIREEGFFTIEKSLLKAIADARTVKMRLVGHENSITAKFTKECFKAFRVFYQVAALGKQGEYRGTEGAAAEE